MKKLLLFVFVLITISTTTLVIAFNQDLKEKITKSLSSGDVETLSTCFADDVLLELFDQEEYADPAAIKKRLYTFFEQYPAKDFKVRHENRTEHKKYAYLIGILQTEEEVFRVTITIEGEQIVNINIIFEAPIG